MRKIQILLHALNAIVRDKIADTKKAGLAKIVRWITVVSNLSGKLRNASLCKKIMSDAAPVYSAAEITINGYD